MNIIPGIKNVSAGTLCRLIKIDKEVELKQEEEGKEFVYIPFQELPVAQTKVITECLVSDTTDPRENAGPPAHKTRSSLSPPIIKHSKPTKIDLPVTLPISDEELIKLQEQDDTTKKLIDLWNSNKLDRKVFTMENYILRRVLIEDGILYNPTVLPELLRDCVLILAHDKQGHNGSLRVYNSIKRLHYWKGMKKQIQNHCSKCMTCAKFNSKVQEFEKKHFSSPPQPIEFISMDLIGEFIPASGKGNRYALTAVCMLTGFTFCIPIASKSATDVANAYLNHIYCAFGPSRKILTDNGTEFKNKLWTQVDKLIDTEHRVTPVYSPQCNGIKGFHKFLKLQLAKRCKVT